ncbi:MAG: non-canonical purine NTP pyrophosphatase [Kofleriaceae bacterium]
MIARFVDGTDLRAAEVRRAAPDLAFELCGLPSGYSTSAPDPERRARDMVLAVEHGFPCFAEAVDLLTLDGKSLRLELDSENDNRFCRWWRETQVQLVLCVALRRTEGHEVEVFHAVCPGRIADRPSGPRELGWDRLFVPDGFDATFADLVADADATTDTVGLRRGPYQALTRALAT